VLKIVQVCDSGSCSRKWKL